MTDEAPPTTCGHPTAAGPPCRQTSGLSPVNGLCLTHDPERKGLAQMHQRKAVRGGKRGIVHPRPDELPGPLETIDDCIRWASWLAQKSATGEIDPAASRECNKAIQTLRFTLDRKGNQDRRIKELEKRLAAAAAGVRKS